MSVFTAGTELLAWVNEEWAEGIDIQAYHDATVYPLIETMPKPYGTFHSPKSGNLSVQSITSATTDLATGITFNVITETEATYTPRTATVPVQINLNAIARMKYDPKDVYRRSIEMALPQQADQDVAALVTSLTTNFVGNTASPLDLPTVLEAYRKGAVAGKAMWRPGKQKVYGCIHDQQIDRFLTIEQITSAQIRGDDEKPVKSGWVAQAYGVYWYPAGTLPVNHSMMFIPDVAKIGWNQKFTVLGQDFNLTAKVIGWGDYSYGLQREEYGVDMRHN